MPVCQSTNLRWRAITQRDPTAHRSFIYGVKTTRIYCRPTCTARVARRANVVYYETAAQARLDGFKPCTKCKPDDPMFLGQREEIVLRTLDVLRDDLGNAKFERSVKALAKDVGVTPSYLCRVFKGVMGCTIGHYCTQFEQARGVDDDDDAVACLNETTCPLDPEPPGLAGCSQPGYLPIEPVVPVEDFPGVPDENSAGPRLNFESGFNMDLEFDEWL